MTCFDPLCAKRRLSVTAGKASASSQTGSSVPLLCLRPACEWLRAWLLEERPVNEIRRHLLLPSREAPTAFVPAGRIVCQCHGVTTTAIAATLAANQGSFADRLGALQSATRCGTQCGSCLPEVRRLVATACEPAAETDAMPAQQFA